jgi:hypothetical protein
MRRAAFLLLPLLAGPRAWAAPVLTAARSASAPQVRLAPMLLSQPGLAGGPGLGALGAAPVLSPLPALAGAPSVSAAPVVAAVPAVFDERAAVPSAQAPGVPLGLEAARSGAAVLFDGAGPKTDEAIYLDGLLQQTRGLYRRFFPAFEAEFAVRMASSRNGAVEGTRGSHEVDPRKKDAVHEITLLEDSPLGAANERERTLTPFARSAAKNPGLFKLAIQRWVSRAVTLFHEYSHGVFHQLTPGISRGMNLPEPDMIRVDLAAVMDEGFAVMMELLLIDRMAASAGELGLSPGDVSDLRVRKKQRLFDMRHRRDHYAAGTYYFIHRLYKREGEEGLLSFLKDLDMGRLYTLFTYDPSYRLIQGSPQLFRAYLTRTGDARLREGVDALAAYLAGRPAAPGELDGLRDILRRVDRSALTRVARLYIRKSAAESEPGVYGRFRDRVALLDPAAARDLPEFSPAP